VKIKIELETEYRQDMVDAITALADELAFAEPGDYEHSVIGEHDDDTQDRIGSVVFEDDIEHDAITAEVHSDDYIHEANFDATKWFEQASDEEILALARCEWGFDYPADYVAKFFEGKNHELDDLFEYCRKKHGVGFECSVEAGPALAWIERNRPHLTAEASVPVVR
jgi:hypothetical protein